MERYVCFDIGDRRIGVAISDPFNTYALPSEVYVRKGFAADVEAVAGIAEAKGATAVVCGLPVSTDLTESEQTRRTRRFIDALRERLAVPVICENEMYTTVEAHETLSLEGMDARDRKKCVDAVAAAEILDGYLGKINR